MKVENVYHISNTLHSFRPGEPALIIGVKMVVPRPGLTERLCYHVRYEDGFEDYKVLSDYDNERADIKTLNQLLKQCK